MCVNAQGAFTTIAQNMANPHFIINHGQGTGMVCTAEYGMRPRATRTTEGFRGSFKREKQNLVRTQEFMTT